MTPRRPSGAELRRAAGLYGPGPKTGAPVAKIRRWQPHRNPAGTVLGYLDVQLPSGMIVNGCKLMVGPAGKHWIAPPSQQQTNKDGSPKLDPNGKPIWSQTVEFVDRAASDRFRDLVLDALRRDYPEAAAPPSSSPPRRSPPRTRRSAADPGLAGAAMVDDGIDDLWAGGAP
jgi:hypothetical protein